MSIKEVVKACCPRFMFPILKEFYHKVIALIVSPRALKYLPYYQDELSRKILRDRLEYLKTSDINIFLNRAEKEGWTFSGLYRVDGRSEYSYGADNRKEHSDVIVVYDKKGPYLDYARKLMIMMYGVDSFRCIELEKFLKYARIFKSSLIVPVIKDITVPGSIREDLQYFDVFSPVDNEIIVDAGAYDGGTAIQFLDWGKGKVRRIYSFEFDPVNATKCEENLKPHSDKVIVVKKGTWDREETAYADIGGGAGSSVLSTGSTEIQLTSIDNIVKDEPVTFIKMDVEGAELKSLMGAKSTIIKNRPRLAICVYHKPQDIYEIPAYILSLVPEYRFYLRHYSSREWETVLYAYCE